MYSVATQADFLVFRNREHILTLVSDSAITDYTLTATAESSDGLASFNASVTKDTGTKTWTIKWTNTQTAAMTDNVYLYDIKLLDGSNNDTQAYYGTFTMKDTITA